MQSNLASILLFHLKFIAILIYSMLSFIFRNGKHPSVQMFYDQMINELSFMKIQLSKIIKQFNSVQFRVTIAIEDLNKFSMSI